MSAADHGIDTAQNPADLQSAPSHAAGGGVGDAEMAALRARAYQLQQQGQKGASWFFWVAAMSVINTIIIHSGGESQFVLGLSATMIADVFAGEVAKQAPGAAIVAKGIAIAFDVFVVLLVVGTGYLARRRYVAIYGIGMFLYLLDGLVFILAGEWMSVAIHGLALFYMLRGFAAFRKLNRIMRLATS